ncbi:uncharacterized protein L969DRAFT_88559 [Mixia osmundae IAM 14324]|uniref:uncharacterized protein n=1 Tax=Mixia osmundae (strain CBS 9802 / IAM 14324 / JCM 22182 / KY 12970) TaxID=764103 RepID=UPI0004A55739|nr:uncharacterized protein L969DRAFT_88559 [Mixia osmundae IAM 14324]KEI39108.1 hypothetical protein L969DRAFT_88559 [Mixia osmundae IAM 14324]
MMVKTIMLLSLVLAAVAIPTAKPSFLDQCDDSNCGIGGRCNTLTGFCKGAPQYQCCFANDRCDRNC